MNEDSKLDSPPEIQADTPAPLAASPDAAGDKASNDPRWVAVKPSRIALALTGVMAMAALAVILWVPIPMGLQLVFLAFWLVAAFIEIRAGALLEPTSVLAFSLKDADAAPEGDRPPLRVALRTRRDNRELEADLLYGGVVTPWFTTLKYRLPGDAAWRRFWPRVVPLWVDAIDAEAFRKLRVTLRWK